MSSIVSYGLSTVAAGGRNPGVSSLSSIVSYGLSTVAAGGRNPGVSSLSSIVSYGLSTVYSPYGISSLSSIVSYGLSTVYSPYGVSSLSSIVSYGLSTVYSNLNIRVISLELSNNFLKSNTWIAPFRPSTIGGTDIKDLSTGNPDTYTNALAKIDAWIYKNLIDQPPPPTYNSQTNSVTSLSFYWKKPDQFKVGILNVYSPYISSIHFELYSNIAPNSISSNLFSTFVFGEGLVPFNRFQVEGVEFTNSNSSIFNFNSVTNTVQIGINSEKFNYNNGPYNLNMYFKNYSSNIYSTLLFNPQNMGLVSPPSAPQSVVFTNITTRTATIIIQKPLYNASNLFTETYPPLQDYRAILSSRAIQNRRYNDTISAGTVTTYNSIPYTNDFQNFSLGNNILYPDVTYFITISARNVINNNFGNSLISSNFRAALPTSPGTLTSITSCNTNNSFLYDLRGENILPIDGIKLSNLQIYNRNLLIALTDPLSFYTNSDLGIHSASNSGSTSNNICSLTVTTDGGAVTTVEIGGFAPSYTSRITSGTTSIILASNIADYYGIDPINNNFYLIFTGYIYLKNTYLTARANPYSFSLRHSNSFHITTCNSPLIRVDNINTPPSIQSIIIPAATSFKYISGVPIYSYNNTLTLAFVINNLATNFYISGQNLIRGSLLFEGLTLGTPFVANTTVQLLNPDGSAISSTPIPVQSRIDIPGNTFNNSVLYTPANTGGARVTTQLILSNLAGSATQTVIIPGYFDAKSEILVDTILNSELNGTGGLHMLSDGGHTTTLPSSPYIHNQHIKGNGSINFNEELPILNGLFRTSANIGNAYTSFNDFTQINGAYAYPDYTFIDNEVDGSGYIRYATFKYTFTNTTTSNIHKIQFNLSNLTGLQCNVGINPYNTSIVTYLAYRIDNVGEYNTPWLHGNTIRTNIKALTSAVTILTSGVRSNDLIHAPITNSSRFFSVIPIPPNCNFDIYVKIGLQMQASITFQNIFMIPYYGILPSAPQNLVLSLQDTNLNLSWSIPANYSEPLINYILSIEPSCNAIYPRRYVPTGSRISQETYFLSNTLGVQITSYLDLFDNYDTLYIGRIALENDVGIGAFGISGSVQTPLPLIQHPIFSSTTASNLDLNAAYKNYFPFCNAYNFRDIKAAGSGNIIRNILLPQTSVYFDWLHNGTTSNIFTVNDSNTSGQGLSNFSYTARQIDNSDSSLIATTTYTFSNNLYINSNTETSVSSSANGTLQVNVTRLRDTYSSGSRTGFYMRAYPNILLGSLSGTPRTIYYQLGNATTTLTSGLFNVDSTIAGNATPIVTNITTSESELTTNSATYSNYICGVLIFTSGAPYSQWIQVTNLGCNYIRSNAVAISLQSNSAVSLCNFPFNSITTPFYLSQGGATYTDAPIRVNTFFNWNIQLAYPIYTPCNAPSFVGTACNLHGTGSQSNFRLVAGAQRPIFFDTRSIIVRNNTLQSNFVIGGINYGARVESGSGSNPDIGTFGSNFNDTRPLVGAYSNEIQLTNGSYRTYSNAKLGGSSNGYLDYRVYYNPYVTAQQYSNYDIIGATGMRYLTLKWSFSSGINDWRSATINFTFADANSAFSFDQTNLVFRGITIQWRIIASNDMSPLLTNFTTEWLNANAISAIPPNNTTKNIAGTPIGLNYEGAQADANNVRIFYPSLSGLSYSQINHSVYVRIGFPMNSNISLQYITYTPTATSSIPQSVTELSISNSVISDIPLCNSIIRWERQMDGINIQSFIGTYGTKATTIGTIVYPRRFGGTIISDSGSFNTPGIDSQQSYTNLFIPQNYDTYYFATIIASNISGKAPITSNISINSTALPPLRGDSFSGILRTNVAAINYSRNAILFLSRSGEIVNSNLIYNRNNLMTAGSSQEFSIFSSSNIGVAQSRVIVNSNTNAIGNVSNIVWRVDLFRNNSLVVGANYSFSNQSFSRSNNNIVVASNSTFSWGFNYITDMYLNNIYTSNFYIVAQPNIKFNNSYLDNGSSNYRLLITNSNDTLSNSVNFYIDSVNTAPSGRIFLENIGGINGISYCNICGVPVITTNTFNFWIETSNIGSNFFVPQPVSASLTNDGSFNFNRVTTPFYSSCNTGRTYSSGPISNVTFFYWSNVVVTNVGFGAAPSYNISGSVSNLVGEASLNTGSGFKPYYDPLSIATLSCNVRVVSGGDTTAPGVVGYNANPPVGTFGSEFNNNISIAANNELQLVNGNYSTKSYVTSTGYENYINNYFNPVGGTQHNYSVITANPLLMRYVSFIFSNINPIGGASNKIDTITLKLYYKTVVPTYTGGYYNTEATFQVRINSNTATTSNNSSGWLNANAALTGNISINNKINDNQACITVAPTYTSDTDPIETRIVKIPDGCGYSNMNFFTRLGFNMATPYAIQRIQIDTQTTINIPNQFNATLYVNCNVGQRQQFYINLLPCLPIATYCNLSASFSNTNLPTVTMGQTAITHLSNYSFTGNNTYSNISNAWIYGTFIISRDNGTPFYTSNLIQSQDYYVARPLSAIISFSNIGGGAGVWNLASNYLSISISNIPNLTNGQIFYTFSNDTRTVLLTSSNYNITQGIGGIVTISSNLTSNQYLNRAFYVSCFTRAQMQTPSETRDSGILIGNSNGLFSPPSGFSVTTANSGTNGISQYFYTSQLFTFTITSATYSNYTYSNGGFPRRVGGYIAGNIDSAQINNPVFSFSRTSPFNVYDTNYYATLYLTYTNGGSCNTDPVNATSRTMTPQDTRNSWGGSFNIIGTTYPNLGYGGVGVGAVSVYRAGTTINTFNRNFVSINTNLGSVTGRTITISDQTGTCNYNFIDDSYNYTNASKSNRPLTIGNRRGTLSTYDAVAGLITPARLNDTGFWMALDLQYSNTYVASPNAITTTISLNGSPITNTVYVDNDPGIISLGSFSPSYSTQPGVSHAVNTHLIGSTAISVRTITSASDLTINNIFVNIKPFNFGRITLTYTYGSTTTSTTNNYIWSDISAPNITLPITIFGSIPTNTITTYNMAVSFSNIRSNVTSNITDQIFNDLSFDGANQVIRADNPGFTNATPKWILGAWRTDMTGLSFTLEDLRATHGNATFQIGPGFIIYSQPVSRNTYSVKFNIITNVANFGFTSITAFYPAGVQGEFDPPPTYGTFDCLVNDGGIGSTTISGGCLANTPTNNNYEIYCPFQYYGGAVIITISLDAGQNITNIIRVP